MRTSRPTELGRLWAASAGKGSRADYDVLSGEGGIFVAKSRNGEPALLVEVARIPVHAVGRQAAGFDLRPHDLLSFSLNGHSWKSSAAALVCTDSEGLEAFTVLASDIESRLRHTPTEWASLLAIVEEWQSLLARKTGHGREWEMGLWGEMWLLNQASHLDQLVAGWRGPDRESTDFLFNGRAVEVKASRTSGRHWVSRKQVESPVGEAEAFLLSLWVGLDPIAGTTLSELIAAVLARSHDPATTMRRLAVSGYSPGDRGTYQSRFALLNEPQWYRIEDVPRVRAVDIGVSNIRYLVTLDEEHRIHDPSSLWEHFVGHRYMRTL